MRCLTLEMARKHKYTDEELLQMIRDKAEELFPI